MKYPSREHLLIVSNIFSLITIGLSVVAKVPQILTLYCQRSARGISFSSLCLDTFSYTVWMAYNYGNGYSVMSYMECPILLVQMYVYMLLVMYFRCQLTPLAYAGFVAYFICTVLVMVTSPVAYLAPMVPLCTPIKALSKIFVIVEMVRTKDSSNVSLTTWFLSICTNLMRIFTILVDSADPILLFSFSVSGLLSAAVFTSALSYKTDTRFRIQ